MKSKTQGDDAQPNDHQPQQDNGSARDSVKDVSDEGLSYPSNDSAQGSYHRNGESAPAEFFAHGKHEYPKAVEGTGYYKVYKEGGSEDVPAKEQGLFKTCDLVTNSLGKT